MSSEFRIEHFSGIDKFSQKCLIPIHLFERTNFKLGEFVVLKASNNIYLSRVFINVKPLTSIFVDDTVSCTNPNQRSLKRCKETLLYPDNIAAVKLSIVNQIHVKVILKENQMINLDKIACENLVHKILRPFAVMKDCSINCEGLKLAGLFNINKILVCNILPPESHFGKLTNLTSVELLDVTSPKLISQKESLKCLQLGGMEHIIKILKFNLIKSHKSYGVLLTGPSGSGKSLLVKKFCDSLDCFSVFIDGLMNLHLTPEECDSYLKQFSCYLRIFPNLTCLLVVDHLDALVPSSSKQNISVVSSLISLVHSLKELGVYVVATASHRKNLDFKVSSVFHREVNVGIPSLLQRKEILAVLAQELNCQVDNDKISRMTPGFVGHDLALLLEEAKSKHNLIDSTSEDVVCLTDDDIEKALEVITPSVLKTSLWNIKVKPVYWKDIGGMFHVKKRLQMCIEWPLRNPEVFKKVDLPCPHGILLFGPPGCCKTTLARGLATECNANFFAANPAQIYSPYVGESEKNIIELFYQARMCAPSIIFLDELDSLVSQRKLDTKSQGVGEKVLSTLLNEMDGFGTKMQFQSNLNMLRLFNKGNTKSYDSGDDEHPNDDIIVVAATNRPDLIDDALLRPGRFDVILYVPPPNLKERVSVLQTLSEGMPLRDIDLEKIAERTDMFSGADLKNLCNEAALNALRHDIASTEITQTNFEDALKKVKPSITREQLKMYEKLSLKYGTVIRST